MSGDGTSNGKTKTNGKVEHIELDPWKLKLSELDFIEKSCKITFIELGGMLEDGKIPVLVQGALVAVVRHRLGEIDDLAKFSLADMELEELSQNVERFRIVAPPANREERRARKPVARKGPTKRPEA